MGNKVDENIRDAILYMVYCSLHGQKIDSGFFKRYDSQRLLKICKAHKISALASLCVDEANTEWKKEYLSSLRRTVLFDEERKRIVKLLDKNGIWYCLLKGIVLKDLYPKYGTREMSDNDILFNDKKRKLVRDIMAKEKYSFVDTGNTNHDVYHKKPIFNFEFHHALFNSSNKNHFKDYYSNIKTKLIKNADSDFEYHFTDEDFYIYYIAHNHKHLASSGSGLRTLIDIYTYLVNHENLNWNYIKRQFEVLDIAKEEELLRSISFKLFDEKKGKLTQDEDELLNYMSNSGTYGTVYNRLMKQMKEYGTRNNNRVYYLFRRLIPEEELLEIYYPFFYKNKWAIPILPIYRGAKMLITDPKRLMVEFKVLFSKDDKKNG